MTDTSRFVGVHEEVAPAATAARYPGARWTREFVSDKGRPLPETTLSGDLIRRVRNATQPAHDVGGACMVSVKLDLTSVAAGRWDERLAALGVWTTGLGGRLAVVFNHEPENDMPAEKFVAGFNAARTAFKATAPDIPVGYAAMAYHWRPSSKAHTYGNPQTWAAVLADLYLVDVYSGQAFPDAMILPEHPGFLRWYDEVIVKNPGRRWGLAERGWHSGPTRAATILREATWFATDPIGRECAGSLVWGTGGTENNPAWVLSDLASRQAVAGYTAVLSAPTTVAFPGVD